ncbi:hypothetical protein BH23DEI1_BH23DEI1_06370 [soil metagenome]
MPWGAAYVHHEGSGRRDTVDGDPTPKEDHMLWTIAVILVVLWLLGVVTNFVVGGFIHVLLVIAVIVVLVRLFTGRSPA